MLTTNGNQHCRLTGQNSVLRAPEKETDVIPIRYHHFLLIYVCLIFHVL
jgi:hypothetical protein